MVVVGPHRCLVVVVVGSLRGLSMVVVGPRGWWWVCSSPLFGNGGGLFVSSHCRVALSLRGVVNVQSSSVIVVRQWVVLTMTNDIVRRLIAMSMAAT